MVEEEWMATRRALPKIAECACCCRAVHYSRSGSAAAIGGGATVHARCGLLRHSRNAGITVAVALSVGTGSAAKPLKGWDVIGGWLLQGLWFAGCEVGRGGALSGSAGGGCSGGGRAFGEGGSAGTGVVHVGSA